MTAAKRTHRTLLFWALAPVVWLLGLGLCLVASVLFGLFVGSAQGAHNVALGAGWGYMIAATYAMWRFYEWFTAPKANTDGIPE
jgi:hypothetical protein